VRNTLRSRSATHCLTPPGASRRGGHRRGRRIESEHSWPKPYAAGKLPPVSQYPDDMKDYAFSLEICELGLLDQEAHPEVTLQVVDTSAEHDHGEDKNIGAGDVSDPKPGGSGYRRDTSRSSLRSCRSSLVHTQYIAAFTPGGSASSWLYDVPFLLVGVTGFEPATPTSRILSGIFQRRPKTSEIIIRTNQL
jgi:hypothetical protein